MLAESVCISFSSFVYVCVAQATSRPEPRCGQLLRERANDQLTVKERVDSEFTYVCMHAYVCTVRTESIHGFGRLVVKSSYLFINSSYVLENLPKCR